MRQVYLAHYHEIALKGKNRGNFEWQLRRNLGLVTGLPLQKIKLIASRFVIESNEEQLKEKLKYVFGLSSFGPALAVEPTIEKIQEAALNLASLTKIKSFLVSTSRSDKSFFLTSPEINRLVGEAIREKTKAKVDLKNPQQIFWIEITSKEAYIYTEKFKGAGGLPVGSEGRVLVLLSGGIDSPVAGYFLAKRGALVDFIHFHSYPFTSSASLEKVKQLVKILNSYTLFSRLFLIPFGEIQKEIFKECQESLRVILYRRLMYRIAEKIAQENEAQALVTGESLGQVASQTLDNLRVIEEAISLPVFRPLIGFDKEEIISLAQQIGTFEISILPHEDCCTLFLPKKPATKAKLANVLQEENKLPIKKMIKEVIKKTEIISYE
jgi:thiamine biosynthesis protein ThiI